MINEGEMIDANREEIDKYFRKLRDFLGVRAQYTHLTGEKPFYSPGRFRGFYYAFLADTKQKERLSKSELEKMSTEFQKGHVLYHANLPAWREKQPEQNKKCMEGNRRSLEVIHNTIEVA